MASIANRERFPDVNFLPDSKIKIIGDVGGVKLALIGKEMGTDAPVVSRCQSDPTKERLFAIPLYELLTHSTEPVNIPEKF